ncbi:GlcG/HbpS family heme-binding protein [Vagococcus hydrophili]|uniref:GlcG/HbpS family heme-binding protein n=1 Tax=Vagococcus hydrophili TaxID=2714947 RepID=UPI001EEB3F6B|nr:heme-binding protein [Vagococcus hydrophili]
MNNIDKLVEKALITIQSEALFSKENLQKTIDVAESKAREIEVPVTICISDLSGNPRMFYRMEDAKLVSLTLAPKKALSALLMQAETKDLNKETQPNGELYQIETMMDGKLVTFAGGIPIFYQEKIIGAIGVSGGKVSEDQEICETAVRTFLKGESSCQL